MKKAGADRWRTLSGPTGPTGDDNSPTRKAQVPTDGGTNNIFELFPVFQHDSNILLLLLLLLLYHRNHLHLFCFFLISSTGLPLAFWSVPVSPGAPGASGTPGNANTLATGGLFDLSVLFIAYGPHRLFIYHFC